MDTSSESAQVPADMRKGLMRPSKSNLLQGPMSLAKEAEKAAEGLSWSAGRSAISEIPRPAPLVQTH